MVGAPMSLTIQLLGAPSMSAHGGDRYRFRSRKSWGLLAYLILRERAPSRAEMSSLLFPEAEDPRRALRWNLSEIRQAFRDDASIGGDPLILELDPRVRVDVLTVTGGSWTDAIESEGLGRDLLEGMSFGSPSFETWLLIERQRLRASSEAVLHEAALGSLSKGDSLEAIELATRLVEMNPLDENHQALLIRALRLSGDLDSADRQLEACRQLFRDELGVAPGMAVKAAARAHPKGPQTARGSAEAMLEAGSAAIAAGAIPSGIETLRSAVVQADEQGKNRLMAEVRIALAEALIHSLRGEDEEGTTTLHEASDRALDGGYTDLAARAQMELGYVNFLRARYDRAEHWLTQARRLAGRKTELLTGVEIYLGAVASDRADYVEAERLLRLGSDLADRAGTIRRKAYAESVLGRLFLLKEDLDTAAEHLRMSIELSHTEHWLAFLPWPQALLGEVETKRGNLDAATQILEQAFARACQVGDPCWEGAAARALALLADARGDSNAAIRSLEDARLRCNRLSDTYIWLDGYILDALCLMGRRQSHPDTQRWAEELHQLASRTGMKELTVRALRHQTALGTPGTLDMAKVLVADIDNPALARLVE